MADEVQGDQNIRADNNSIAIGGISVDGNVGDIRIGHIIGFTSEQVNKLITQISTTFQPKPFDGNCPYKGLDFFEEEDAELFFGREKLIQDLVSRMKASCMVFVTGPSGSGKSSLVRAGLLHALKQGAIPGSDHWLYATIHPGREPIQALARAVAGLVMSTNAEDEIRLKAWTDESIFARWCEIALKDGREKRVVLFIDQFEEVFTQLSKEEERVAFLNLLTHTATVENGRVILLFAMRSDFVSNCATYPKLNALLNQQFVQIGAMQADELVSAIAQPALRAGLRIDPDLIAQIINDMQGEPGALPLMQFALKDLFDFQQQKAGMIALTLKDYLERGGIRKALERHADKTFATFSTEEQELARSIFTGLIEVGRGTQDTRRMAIFDELIPAGVQRASVEAVVAKLADARLITTDEIGEKDTVTISHEKLIDAWPWLKKLVNENRDVIALQNEIAEDANEWDEHRRDTSYLYTGARLINVHEQLNRKQLVLSGTASEFVQAGFLRQQREQRARIFSIAGVAGLIIAGIAIFSYISTTNAKNLADKNIANTQAALASTFQANAATAQAASTLAVANEEKAKKLSQVSRVGELAAQSVSLRERNFLISSLLSVEASKRTNGLFDSVQAESALLDNVQSNPQLEQFLSRHSGAVDSVAFSPDGKTLASSSGDKTIILWDVKTHQPIGQPLRGHSDAVFSVAFSSDGKTLASGSRDKTIILWNMETHEPIGQPMRAHSDAVYSVAFSPDGKILASGSWDKTIILWDMETRQPIGQPLRGHLLPVSGIAFSPDGKTLASGSVDSTITLWDVETRRPIGGRPLSKPVGAAVLSVAFSPDGKILASGRSDKTIILWDMGTHEPIGQPMRAHSGTVYSVTFSPDGKTLASGSGDNMIILWDMETHLPIGQPMRAHSGTVYSVTFSPDGKTLVSGSEDGIVILWNMENYQSISIGQPLSGHSDAVSSVAFSPDGKTLASGSHDETIILWDMETRQPIGQLSNEHSASILTITFSPDGKTLASSSWYGTIILWDAETRQPIGQPLRGHSDAVFSVAFSSDGKILASGSGDKTIILWDMETHEPIGQPMRAHSDAISSVTFSPDGKILASGSWDKTIILWDVETRQPIGQPLRGHSDAVSSVAFSPDGKTLASGSDDGTVILWDVKTHQPIGQAMRGYSGHVQSIAFNPDGKTLASGNEDTTIILWDIETRQSIGQPLSGHSSFVSSVVFSPDGKTLASGSADGTIVLWDLDAQSWLEKSCKRTGRNFTRVEWERYFPNEEYRKTCEQWPLEPKPIATPTATP